MKFLVEGSPGTRPRLAGREPFEGGDQSSGSGWGETCLKRPEKKKKLPKARAMELELQQ